MPALGGAKNPSFKAIGQTKDSKSAWDMLPPNKIRKTKKCRGGESCILK